MRLENDIKLDYDDVLLTPKRSTLMSRKEVVLLKKYFFKNSQYEYSGIPIMVANMDAIASKRMAEVIHQEGLITVLHKHYSKDDLLPWLTDTFKRNPPWYSMGITESDYQRYLNFINCLPEYFDEKSVPVCVDVANGYSEGFLDFVARFRDKHPFVPLMAGNVVTANMTEELILKGVDVAKIGIGPGCFVPESKVKTHDGLKSIEEIKVGDLVLTHRGRYQEVTNTFEYQEKKQVVSVNGIKSTTHHEYYVLHKKYKDIVDDNNIHEYAEWIAAEELTRDYYLIEIKD